MTNLLQLSADVIDGRVGTDEVGPLNRINFQLSELADDVAMVEAFSHSILFKTGEGLVVFDTSNLQGSGRVVDAVRNWSKDPFHSLVYTHGHMDHVGGAARFYATPRSVTHAREWWGMKTLSRALNDTMRPMAITQSKVIWFGSPARL